MFVSLTAEQNEMYKITDQRSDSTGLSDLIISEGQAYYRARQMQTS
jgi:hypothetical protein